jgi:phosphatidylserine/phosphatidylglycerophosphate/cardiolipin synthase-like enzyme
VRLDLLDDRVGDAIDRIVSAHERRRLRRHGWRRAYDPPTGALWCAGDPPPRDGNRLEVLVDGVEALPRIEQAIAEADESVQLAGWHFQPDFRLSRGGPTLRELLAAAAGRVDVRVLAWAGAPLPLFHPTRSEVRAAREALVRGTRIRMALDRHERPLHCHHEKLAVIDGRIAFVGGIDLTALDGDRLDTPDHPPRGAVGWHDAAARVEGPLVRDVAEHFAFRWGAVTGEQIEPPPPPDPIAGGVPAQFVRTVAEGMYDGLPHGDHRVLEAYVRALRSARRLVYVENQFLWSAEVAGILAAKLRDPPSDEFRVVLLLPARPTNGADDTRGQLGVLVDADRDDRLLACTLYQPGRVEQVYVHAKIAVVDDHVLLIGSANLNEHSLMNDSEACLVVCDETVARETRLRLWREHLQRDDVSVEAWHERAADPAYDRLAYLPSVSRRSRRFLGPLQDLVVDG